MTSSSMLFLDRDPNIGCSLKLFEVATASDSDSWKKINLEVYSGQGGRANNTFSLLFTVSVLTSDSGLVTLFLAAFT